MVGGRFVWPTGQVTCLPAKSKVKSFFRKKWTNLRPGASNHVHALRRPLSDPWAGHVPQVDIELQQAGGFLQLLGQQLYHLMFGLIRGAGRPPPG